MKTRPRCILLVLLLALTLACGGESSDGSANPQDTLETAEVADDAINTDVLIEIVPRECNKAADCVSILGEPGQCQDLVCDESTWTCALVDKTAGTSCSDGDPCTKDDSCQAGECEAGADQCDCRVTEDCAGMEDDDLCNGTLYCRNTEIPYKCVLDTSTIVSCKDTQDTTCSKSACDPELGACVMTPVEDGTACDDGDVCSDPDTCQEGVCAGNDLNCDCQDDVDCIAFDDGDLCNGYMVCDKATLPYACVVLSESVITCNDGFDTDCQYNQCDPPTGTCQMGPAEPGTDCDDGNYCTIEDACFINEATGAGTCGGNGTRDCDDDNICTNDGCDKEANKCSYVFNNAPCTDYNQCYDGDSCSFGFCVGGAIPVNCDDVNACTFDSCEPEVGCVYENKDCKDEDLCTVDLCDTVTGNCYTQPTVCDDANPCTLDACVAPDVGCTFEPKDCQDELLCTIDSCELETGDCLHEDRVCDDGNDCSADFCDAASGDCDATSVEDDSDCQDGFDFTINDHCISGACVGDVTQPATTFRITSYAVEAPQLQIDGSEGPIELNELLSAFATAEIGVDGFGEAALLIAPLRMEYPYGALAYGQAACLYDDADLATSCGLSPDGWETNSDPLDWSVEGSCADAASDTIDVSAPCFRAPVTSAGVFSLGAVTLDTEASWASATLTNADDAPVDGLDGYINMFVTSAHLATVQIQHESLGLDFMAGDAVAHLTPETYEAVDGFWFRVHFTAEVIDPYAAGIGCNVEGIVCDDDNECSFDVCDTTTGDCVFTPVPNGNPCDDGFDYTDDDACQENVCLGESALASARFRATEIDIVAPSLRSDLGAGEVEINALVNLVANAQIQAGVWGGEDVGVPMVSIDVPGFGYPHASVTLSYGHCSDETSRWAYDCETFTELPSLEAAVSLSADSACATIDADGLAVEAPCFRSETLQDFSFAFDDMPLVAKTGWAAGTFAQDPFRGTGPAAITGVEALTLMLFVTEAAVADLSFPISDAERLDLTDILDEADKVEQDGDMGWWFRIDLKTERYGQAKPEAALFRVNDFRMPTPELTWDMGSGSPVRINELVDVIVTAGLRPDHEGSGGPLVIVDPIASDYPEPGATMAYGTCQFPDAGDSAEACHVFDSSAAVATPIDSFQSSTACATADDDGIDVPAPCFRTPVGYDLPFEIDFASVVASEGWSAATLVGAPATAVEDLAMVFFATTTAVAAVEVPIDDDVSVNLGDLLATTPTVTLGDLEGWWFHAYMKAERVLSLP